MKSSPASTESTGWERITCGKPGRVPVSSASTGGEVAPATAIVQPSQLIPASQKAYTLLSGPFSGSCCRSSCGSGRPTSAAGARPLGSALSGAAGAVMELASWVEVSIAIDRALSSSTECTCTYLHGLYMCITYTNSIASRYVKIWEVSTRTICKRKEKKDRR